MHPQVKIYSIVIDLLVALRAPVRSVYVSRRINTLCLEVTRRQEAASELSTEVDVMFVLGGLHSANTRELARLCREAGCDTFHLETWSQFEREMVADKKVAGVTAGASTPETVIAEFVRNLEAI